MKSRRNSFTLVELLVVMAVIAMLSAITLGAAGAIQNKAARSRAGAEIAAMSVALESYKTDNGIYPGTNGMSGVSVTTPSSYITSSTLLYRSLTSTTNWSAKPGGPVYMTFKKNQLNAVTNCYVQDPFGYSYGYCTNSPTGGMNAGFYDLWSTSGKTAGGPQNTNVWVNNWSSN